MAESCDVLVVGAGHAGLAAAIAASKAGARVTLVDDNPFPGGQIARAKLGKLDASIVAIQAELRERGVGMLQSETVVDVPSPTKAITQGPDGIRHVEFKSLVIATGSRELFLPFPGCTLPGVMGAGGLQALAKSGLNVSGKRIVVAGSGPLLLPVVQFLAKAGAIVHGPFEQVGYGALAKFGMTTALKGKLGQMLTYSGVLPKYKPGVWISKAAGSAKVESVHLSNGTTLPCDYVACSYGLVPNTEIARLLGCTMDGPFVKVDAHQRTSIQNVYCAGEPTGIGGHDKATVEGTIAGMAAAGAVDNIVHHVTHARSQQQFAKVLENTFRLRSELLALATEDTTVCRCEDVSFGRLRQQPNLRDAKLQTRCGMGPCQGRICGPAMQALFGWSQDTVRPPVAPVPLAALTYTDRDS